MSFISLKNIHKSYINGKGELRVLRGINLDIDKGKMVAIVGASRAGKSTLLHILGTLDHPSSGELYYNKQNIFSFNNQKLAHFRNKKIGFVFQFHHLLPEFTALENVIMPILISRNNYQIAEKRAQKLLDQVGLKRREHHKPGELSGGEQQRVAIARSLANSPELLLADEPTGNLDSKTSEKIYQLIHQINQEMDLTIVLVTHNETLGSRADRCLTIEDGILQSNPSN